MMAGWKGYMVNEREPIYNPSLPSYASSGYLDWLNPNMSKEQHDRQEEIHRRMSQMMVESYWKQLHDHREAWWDAQRPETD